MTTLTAVEKMEKAEEALKYAHGQLIFAQNMLAGIDRDDDLQKVFHAVRQSSSTVNSATRRLTGIIDGEYEL